MGDKGELKPDTEHHSAGEGTPANPILLADDDAVPLAPTTTTVATTSPVLHEDAPAQRSSGRVRSNRLALMVANEKSRWHDCFQPSVAGDPSQLDYPDERFGDSDDDYDEEE